MPTRRHDTKRAVISCRNLSQSLVIHRSKLTRFRGDVRCSIFQPWTAFHSTQLMFTIVLLHCDLCVSCELKLRENTPMQSFIVNSLYWYVYGARFTHGAAWRWNYLSRVEQDNWVLIDGTCEDKNEICSHLHRRSNLNSIVAMRCSNGRETKSFLVRVSFDWSLSPLTAKKLLRNFHFDWLFPTKSWAGEDLGESMLMTHH